MGLIFTLTGDGESSSIAVYVDGQLLVAGSDHPNFPTIVKLARDGDESVADLFDIGQQVASTFDAVSERVSYADGRLYFDGDPIEGLLVDHILRALEFGIQDVTGLVNFLENLSANPNPESVSMLYDWLQANGEFTIDTDGMLVGYKGVAADGKSIHSGKAIVNGEVVKGRIPNDPGSVIEMPRSEVQFDPSIGCHTGLHVGTYDYARSFGQGSLLEVRVNPRDVVSVPTDCSAQKLRACRYTVVGAISDPYDTPVLGGEYDGDLYAPEYDVWGEYDFDLDEYEY
jgi:hypothetical protein